MKNNRTIRKYLSLPDRKYDYCIVTDCPELMDTIEVLYRGYLRNEAERACTELQVYRIGREEYQVMFEGKTDVQNDPIRFVNNTLFENPFFNEDILALHGAAIRVGSEAVLFLGPTGAGKTTLTAYLVSRGFRYITEDCILINYANELVNPSPLPLHLRDGGVDVLSGNNIVLNYQYVDYYSLKRYIFIPPNVERSPMPIGAVYFINRQDENINRVYPLKTEDAFIRLIKSQFTRYPLKSPYIQMIKKIASRPCYQLEYTRMSFVDDIVGLC